jgi:endogenous inhibitor of DNA gyrase (YacG/DUF329 family)
VEDGTPSTNGKRGRGRPRGEWVTVTCFHCGKKEERPAYRAARNTSGRFFCSEACRNIVGVKPVTIPERDCLTCGTTFRPPNRRENRLFCSVPCRATWQARNQVALVCERCGREFVLPPSDLKVHRGRFCSTECAGLGAVKRGFQGREHNGKPVLLNSDGYLYVWEPDHSNAYANGWVLEHRYVMSRVLGRPLRRDEEVNHINRIKTDNRPENLEPLSPSEHSQTTQAQMRADRLELIEYRRRYGPLPDEAMATINEAAGLTTAAERSAALF